MCPVAALEVVGIEQALVYLYDFIALSLQGRHPLLQLSDTRLLDLDASQPPSSKSCPDLLSGDLGAPVDGLEVPETE